MQLADIDLLDADRFVRGEHHEMFTLMRREAPLYFHDEPEGSGFWNVVKHADLIEVNRQPELFSSQEQGISIFDMGEAGASGAFDTRGVMMLMTDPPKHTRYRRLVSKGFTPRMIEMLSVYLRQRAVGIVDNVIERGECDFVTDLASELPLQAIAEIMGVPQEDRFKLFEWSNKLIGMDDPEYEGDRETGSTAAMELYAYSNALAKERRETPRDDIVTTLINAEIVQDDGSVTSLDEFEFDAFMLLLAVAGNETTRNATVHGMQGLFDYPDQFEKLRSNREELMPTAVDEVIRWATPVLHFRRTATADTELRGQKIEKGDKVVMWHISANRDEDVFEDPFTFDLERSPNEHLAFGGGGAHYCLGANLARMEIRIILDEIVRRMPDIEPTGPPEMLRSNFIGGIKHLPVKFPKGERVAS
ncbi:MAG: cytochrome P450 [Acidobacteria bacterium]|nr:cytochrome P450 [Acidobacteriota bacterium]